MCYPVYAECPPRHHGACLQSQNLRDEEAESQVSRQPGLYGDTAPPREHPEFGRVGELRQRLYAGRRAGLTKEVIEE